MKLTIFLLLNIICFFRVKAQNVSRKFPDGFLFGTATSAYQVEGAWNIDGKGENIWDHFTHTRSDIIIDGSNGDVACDSYNLYEDDINMLVDLGVDFYRFSISWTRVLPTGYSNYINPKGIDYYNNVINALIANNITPVVTMYHWDLPQNFQELGGWTNGVVVNYFVEYARVLLDNFGDRVKKWIVINEIQQICQDGYGVIFAPMLNMSGTADYLCTRNVLLAHAKVYHLYNNTYRSTQRGRIGMTTQSFWYTPATNKTEDIEAAERAMSFHFALFTDPIHSTTGDFPEVVRRYVANKSRQQGYPFSRLPSFTTEEINLMKGTADFLGLNFYTARLTSDANGSTVFEVPSFNDDSDVHLDIDPTWIPGESSWFYQTKDGLRNIINWLTKRYNRPEIWILENGFPDSGEMNDTYRINYYRSHLDQVLSAIFDDGCNVTMYTAWSMMDNFEWFGGYKERFGLYSVDFNHVNKTRRPKGSAMVYKEVIRSREIDWNFTHNITDVNAAPMILSSTLTIYLILVPILFNLISNKFI